MYMPQQYPMPMPVSILFKKIYMQYNIYRVATLNLFVFKFKKASRLVLCVRKAPLCLSFLCIDIESKIEKVRS